MSGSSDTKIEKQSDVVVAFEPMWQVVLFDDNDHTYDYVLEMLIAVFGHDKHLAFKMAVEVDTMKRVVVDVDSHEAAEAKCRRVTSYGADWRLERSKGSMSATIEPID